MGDSTQYKRNRPSLHLEPSTPTSRNMAPAPYDDSPTSYARSVATPGTRDTPGGSSLLQARLRERRAESARQDRRRSVDMLAGNRQLQSSPVTSTRWRDERRPSSSGINSNGMGVKQIEDQVSTLHKQNFDLKLQLYHRQQRQETLEARLEEAEKETEELKQVQEINEELLAELERRDRAIEEAMTMIVKLEDEVDRMKRRNTANTDGQQDASYFVGGHAGPPTSPPQFEETPPKGSEPVSRQNMIARMPSFLSDQSEGVDALRSLYLHRNSDHLTLPKLSKTTDGMDSPRLSVLSESSFPSVYGDKDLKLDDSAAQEEDHPSRSHRKTSSVEKWIESRGAAATPSPVSRKGSGNSRPFLSLNDVLESPLQRLEKLKFALEKHNGNHQRVERASSIKEKSRHPKPLRRVTDNPTLEKQHPLPPTPDTISTSTLRHYQNSTDTIGQDADIGAISRFTRDPIFPTDHSTFKTAVPLRPRSAGETVTSRREGHGWDTETQNDDSSTASLYCPQQSHGPKRIPTPNLFMFGGDSDDDRDWGRDNMFGSANFPPAPTRAARAYGSSLQRSSLIEPSRIEDPNEPPYNTSARYNAGPEPLHSLAKPDLPARRSSLSATTKLRKTNDSAIMGSGVDSNAASSATNQDSVKKPRLFSGRLFGRSETSPVITSLPLRQSSTSTPKEDRSQSQFARREDLDREYDTATPPPIKRSRTVQGVAYRPSSAGTGVAPSGRHMDSFYKHDGAEKGRGAQVETPGGNEPAKNGGRRWFGKGHLRHS